MFKTIFSKRHLKVLTVITLLLIISVLVTSHVFAFRAFPGTYEQSLKARQDAVVSAYNDLDYRVLHMDSGDPRYKHAKDLLNAAAAAKNNFYGLKTEDFVDTDDKPYTDTDPTNENCPDIPKDKCFEQFETRAVEAMNAVNLALIMPVQPGASKFGETGTVPSGSLTQDFLPQVVRLMFRFLSVAILISFIVAGIMMVIAYDNEENITKAKHILYYSLMGFAVVALAYAIVKAITKVNYFGLF